LPVGRGVEAFFLNAKGKTIDYGHLFASPDSLWIELEPGRSVGMIKHLDRYLFREKVTLCDRSASHGQIHLVGPKTEEFLASLTSASLPTDRLGVIDVSFEGETLQIRRRPRSIFGGWDLVLPMDRMPALAGRLASFGVAVLDEEILESLRVSAGLPRYGWEIGEENLAQEIGRDAEAISFVKGCYIGQETVARLDALGHVNKLLRGIEFPAGSAVRAGETVYSGEKAIGTIGSAAESFPPGSRRALAVLRLAGGSPGDDVRVPTEQGDVVGQVVSLPFTTSD
jgi:folate-binding protein YgfZ